MAQQHDDHQQGQLPPELQGVVQQVQARPPRREEGDGDGQADEQHHPRLARADLGDGPGQERPATPEVDDGAQQRGDPLGPCARGEVVADEVGEHRAEGDHGDRDGEHRPEQAAEAGDMAGVPAVAHVRHVVVHPGHRAHGTHVHPGHGVARVVGVVCVVVAGVSVAARVAGTRVLHIAHVVVTCVGVMCGHLPGLIGGGDLHAVVPGVVGVIHVCHVVRGVTHLLGVVVLRVRCAVVVVFVLVSGAHASMLYPMGVSVMRCRHWLCAGARGP